MERENGIIDEVRLEIEDHGILVIVIGIAFEGRGQGYVVTLSEENTYIAIRSILEALDCYQWRSLVGRAIRVERTDGLITRIGHIYKDQWSKRTEE